MKTKMKPKTMTLIFAMLLGFAVMFIGTEQAQAMEGDGSKNNPYQITTYAELKEFAGIVNGGNNSACAVLKNDIDCSPNKDWEPIGSSTLHYNGTFDGDGYTIDGLSNANRDAADYQGLFGSVGSDGVVKNVGLKNTNIQGRYYVGGVIGFNLGKISNCNNNGEVSGSGDYVGGVVGSFPNEGEITDCYNTGTVRGKRNVGGVIGFKANVSITSCYNKGEVSGSGDYVGGVAGVNLDEAKITNCYNTGKVSGSGTYVGGVTGANQSNGSISNSYNTGEVSGNGDYVGGVAGVNWGDGKITNCYNTGKVSGSGTYVGGVTGANQGDGKITNCYNTGKVSGSGTDVGGVTGANQSNGSISNSYNTGEVSGNGDYVGGVTGAKQSNGSISNSHNTGKVSGSKYVGGVTGVNQGDGKITNCYNTGEVSGSDNVGGVAGTNTSDEVITNCYNTGKVSGSGNHVGGVIGYNYEPIANCYNTGEVNGNDYVGGVSGSNSGTINSCYNTGKVSGNNDYIGGIIGNSYEAVTNCYNTGAVKGNNYVGGVAGSGITGGTIVYCYYDKDRCGEIGAINGSDSTDKKVIGLTTEQMTGTKALYNMEFVYGTGETSPWMTKADGEGYWFYPHLEGFNIDDQGKQMHPEKISADYWPPKTEAPWTVATPTFSPVAGDFDAPRRVSIECSTEGATIYYTTDETTPTVDSSKYTEAITVSDTTTIKAIAVKDRYIDSQIASATYTHPKLEPKATATPTAKATAKGKTSLTFGWDKVEGAEGYDIFFSRCDRKGKTVVMKNVKTIKGNKIFSWTKKGLKKKTAYKAYVKAYVMKDGKKTYIKTSPVMHAYTGGFTKKYTNAKAVTVNKTKVTLTQGKSFKVKTKVKKLKKNKKLMSSKHAPKVRYLSSDNSVATVSKSGKITAKGKGTCTIVAFAHNGVSKNIKVTVK